MIYILGGSYSYLTGFKPVFHFIVGNFCVHEMQKIILCQVRLNIKKLRKLRKKEFYDFFKFSNIWFNLKQF